MPLLLRRYIATRFAFSLDMPAAATPPLITLPDFRYALTDIDAITPILLIAAAAIISFAYAFFSSPRLPLMRHTPAIFFHFYALR